MATELGTAKADPELARLSDDELQREYDAAVAAAEAAAATEAIADPRVRELVRGLRQMSDEELLAFHAEAVAELAAQEAELARRRPPPEPTPVMEPLVMEPPIEPHAVEL